MTYPIELVAKAKYETSVFERVSADTGAALIAEIERLRAELEWLRFFYQIADFGPADDDVRRMIEEQYGEELPEGYRRENE